MDDPEYSELAREYGLEDIEDDDQYYIHNQAAGNVEPALRANSNNHYYAAYDDIEDFDDDAGSISTLRLHIDLQLCKTDSSSSVFISLAS